MCWYNLVVQFVGKGLIKIEVKELTRSKVIRSLNDVIEVVVLSSGIIYVHPSF